MRFSLSALLVLLLAAPPALAAGDDHDDHLSEADGVRIIHAWTNATSEGEARVFLEIENTGTSDIMLTGGDTEIADTVTVMGTTFSSKGTGATEIGTFPIPAGSEMALTPDGLFLMLSGLETTLAEGEEFEMHVELDPLGEIEIHVDVEAADATQHSHAGHAH
ncbi:MAG: copper chaperone PCu(A)C [Pseudomonadota bacterium]